MHHARLLASVLAACAAVGTISAAGAGASTSLTAPGHGRSGGDPSTSFVAGASRCRERVLLVATGPLQNGVADCRARRKNAFSSNNWSGYAVTGSNFTSVTGTWTVPSASGSGFSSAWIGIDGFGNHSLIQTGTEQQSGSTTAWWEILPANQTNIDMSVKPGDRMYASINRGCNSSTWTITLIDQTSGANFTTQQPYDGPAKTAEWVLEAPTRNGSVQPLADYSSFDFQDATLNGSSPHLTPGDAITMIQNGKIVSTPSDPNGDGDGFGMIYGSAFVMPPANMLGFVGQGETFQPLDSSDVYVLGSDRHLWLETTPWNSYPPVRSSIDSCVRSFQALGATQALVLGLDGNLWLESAPWNSYPPHRAPVDGSVAEAQMVNDNTIFVLGTDGKLWEETAPYGSPHRIPVDSGVSSFQAINANLVIVQDIYGSLFEETMPFGQAHRTLVDGNVDAFQATNVEYSGAGPSNIYVLGWNGNLWQEYGAFGPPNRDFVDSSVSDFHVLDSEDDDGYPNQVYALRTDGTLWAEPDGNYYNSEPLEIDAKVAASVPLDLYHLTTLGTDGNLWLELTPFGSLPPQRDHIDANVAH